MNKFITHLALLAAMLCFALPSFGQTQSDNIPIRPPTADSIPIDSSHCFVSISPQFSPDCILTNFDKQPEPIPGQTQDCIFACKGNTVRYQALCDSAASYAWTVVGATSYTIVGNGSAVDILWSSADQGSIRVVVTMPDSSVCSNEVCVLLIESPTASCTTMPPFFFDNYGDRIIELCLGESLTLSNTSTATSAPIVANYWESPYGSSSADVYSLTPSQEGVFPIMHLVQNECGCSDTEFFKVVVLPPAHLELSCYGTACAGSSESYTILNPHCGNYFWSVEGGTITSGQNTPTVIVNWGNPASGYGSISIDGSMCDGECDALLTRLIPIIGDHVSIDGPDTVCIGETQLFQLPLWGSTHYQWSVSPMAGISLHEYETENQFLATFSQAGTYTLSASYECPFIDCGPYSSAPKTIVVLEKLAILSSDDVVCIGSSGSYTSSHSGDVLWSVLDSQGHEIAHQQSASLQYVFPDTGRFTIVAAHSSYCRSANFSVVVKPRPPAPSVSYGVHETCPNSGIRLWSTPTSAMYYLAWSPICGTDTIEADTVTVTFGDEVCNVEVFQIEKETGCVSDAYIHTVSMLHPAQMDLSPIHACPGRTISLSAPDQSDNVTYEWTFSPANAATTVSNHMLPSVNVLINYIDTTTSYIINAIVKREFCTDSIKDTIPIIVKIPARPSILLSDTIICQYDFVTFSAFFGDSSDIPSDEDCTWYIDDGIEQVQPDAYSFSTPGRHYVRLVYQPDPDCKAVNAQATVNVIAAPQSDFLPVPGGFDVANPIPGITYTWTFNGDTVSNSVHCDDFGSGHYCCTATDTATGCDNTSCCDVASDTCQQIVIDTSQLCANMFKLYISPGILPPGTVVSWSANNSRAVRFSDISSPDPTIATFSEPGYHIIYAYAEIDDMCFHGRFIIVVDYVPDFKLTNNCDGTLTITDISKYRNGFPPPDRHFYQDGASSPIAELSYPLTSRTVLTSSFAPYVSSTITMQFEDHFTSDCWVSHDFTLIPDPDIDTFEVRTRMCESTPFIFNAHATDAVYYRWDFGDGSYNYGSTLDHTFGSGSATYTVTLTVKNALGCSATRTIDVDICKNELLGGLDAELPKVCEWNDRFINYSEGTGARFSEYLWKPFNTTTANSQYTVNQTGDYIVVATEADCHCKDQRWTNVPFFTNPKVQIIAKSEYCFGEEVKLIGNTGKTNTYHWSISDAAGASVALSNPAEPNVAFTPSSPGSYTATLTVTGPTPGNCARSLSFPFIVHPQPPAPTIQYGSRHCIHTPPVVLQSSTGQSLLWSNGFSGDSALYYAPGYMSAYYIDPASGCPSAKTHMMIDPAPNFDALLTGCYTRCNRDFPSAINVYRFYPYTSSSFSWNWLHWGTPIASGIDISPVLPIPIPGDYNLSTSYGYGCVAESPTLSIKLMDTCNCDSCSVFIKDVQCKVKGCQLIFHVVADVINQGSTAVSFSQFSTPAPNQIAWHTALPLVIAPGSNAPFSFDVEVSSFSQEYISFSLYDDINQCLKHFKIAADWSQCISNKCKVEDVSIDFLDHLSTPHQAVYFNYHLLLPPNTTSLLDVWSQPPQFIINAYIPPADIDGLLMLSYGTLCQMAADGQEICIHAVICIDGNLCHLQYCIPAQKLLASIPDGFAKHSGRIGETDAEASDMGTADLKLILQPNPATSQVSVQGIVPQEIVSIKVFNMSGQQVLSVSGSNQFVVDGWPSGSYIVGVLTSDKQYHYLKLIKK